MKKTFLFLISILGLLGPIGCGKLQMPTTPTIQSKSVSTPVPSTVPQFTGSWSKAGSTPLVNPQGIAVDASGNIYVTDLDLNQVFKFDPNGNLIAQMGNRNGTALDQPTGITVENGNIFVADSSNARVIEYDSNGNYIAQVCPKDANGDLLFLYPTGVSFDKQGNLYVSDNSDEVFEFNSSFQLVNAWGANGATNGIFNYPVVSAEDGNGNVFVVNNNSDQVTKFNPATNTIFSWGSYGVQNGFFDGPSDVKLDPSGNVYVVDSGNNRIQVFTNSGTYLSQFGASSDPTQSLNGPNGLAIDTNGNIYVVDNGNTRIVKYAQN